MVVVYLTGLCLGLFVGWAPVDRLDERATASVKRWVTAHPGVGDVAAVVTWLGSPIVLTIVVLGAAAWLWRRGDEVGARTLVLCGALGAIVETALKLTIVRARPEVEALVSARGTSFPSGHAMNSMIVWVAMFWMLRRGRADAGAVMLAMVVGVSRVILGVHHPGDVMAGWVLAALWLALVLPTRQRGVACPQRER